jgi:hypothetical protein
MYIDTWKVVCMDMYAVWIHVYVYGYVMSIPVFHDVES